MASDIILFTGNSSSKETDYYTAFISPVAFLSDNHAGIRATDNENIDITSSQTYHRGVLAAIRGAILTQELSYVSSDILNSCFCACINQPNDAQKIVGESVKLFLPSSKIKEIKRYVPENLTQMLSSLIKQNILFDGEEIEFDIDKKLIRRTKDLEDILLKNKVNFTGVDLDEYGYKINLKEMIFDMDLDILERAVVRPFLDEYLANCNSKLMKISTHTTSNAIGYCILSKLKRHPNIDFDFVVDFRSDYVGPVDNLSMYVGISPIIKFRKSSEKVKMEFFSKEIIERAYGSKFKPRLEHKMPFLFRRDDASMYLDGPDLKTRIEDFEIVGIVNPVFDAIRKKFLYTKKYGTATFN